MNVLTTVWSGLIDWLAFGLIETSWWQVVLFTLVVTHITICAVTIFLHRAQAHRALELSAVPSHFFRFWLWLTTGMVTREFVAVHRKHHAKCETEEDPHSPQTRGIKALLLTGVELYRAESKVPDTIAKYGLGTPDDWIERNLYTRYSWQGVGVMLIIDLMLFGAIGLTVWAIQMLWIPVMATGIINGIGHWWGYRNFEAPDASANVSPWGFLIGGEELHNNHHTYPTSARFSVKPYEFDVGWFYIRGLEMLGLAKVRKTTPRIKWGALKPVADSQTLDAIIANRYEVMAHYAKQLRSACQAELGRLKAEGAQNSAKWAEMRLARRWLHRDAEMIPPRLKSEVEKVCAENDKLAKLVAMREELRQLWTRTNVSADQLVVDLQNWCRKAEGSGNAALRDFSLKLRAVKA